ncbi:MAG: peptide-methionine (R)-S-oxide reductase MsrB [Synergistaceae bacterium]
MFANDESKLRGRFDRIYLAGGCFWGMDKLMSSICGVHDVVCGYANGDSSIKNPTYDQVCSGVTGYKECVRVDYDPDVVTLEKLLFSFFNVIDPTVKNRQANDIGTQYQTGIFYVSTESKKIVEKVVAIEKNHYSNFSVLVEQLFSFYKAEEYHQKYLIKNPRGYCHIGDDKIKKVSCSIVDTLLYKRPTDSEIRESLTFEEYGVTQNSATEAPCTSRFFDFDEKGIYVDIVSGEPLFSSKDKFSCSCGWPAFSKPIDENMIVYVKDYSHNMVRTEVRSLIANSHLGHVFYNDPESPNGTRFCINGAALRFIPFSEMTNEKYEYLKEIFSAS